MKKSRFKWLFDLLLAVLFLTLLRSRMFSLSYHESAGIMIGFLFAIHLSLNWRWIRAVTLLIFSPKTGLKTKATYIIDLLLFFSVYLTIISGMYIAGMLTQNMGMNFRHMRLVHSECAYLTLFLILIHVGLHRGLIKNMFEKMVAGLLSPS